jgi:hypothetical protein
VAEPLRTALEARLDALAAAVRANTALRNGLCFGQDWAIEAHWPEADSELPRPLL